jgi:hypothetical protein
MLDEIPSRLVVLERELATLRRIGRPIVVAKEIGFVAERDERARILLLIGKIGKQNFS